MKFVLVSAIVLVILPFNICLGNVMPGSPNAVPVNEIDHLKTTIEDFIKSNQNGDDWVYVDRIENVTSQVVAGTLYKIDFVASKTVCSRNDSTKTKENCKVKDQQNCSVSIWEKPWESFVKVISFNCMGINIKQ